MNSHRLTSMLFIFALLGALALSLSSPTPGLAHPGPAPRVANLPTSYSMLQGVVEPQTSFESAPVNLGIARSDASLFTFRSSIAGSTFECKLDEAGFTPCTSPASYPTLAAGSHTLQVRATAPDGTVETTPESKTWTVSPYDGSSREVLKYGAGYLVNYPIASAVARQSNGDLHVVYVTYSQAIYYRWDSSGHAWTAGEVIHNTAADSAMMEPWVSLALSADNRPHVTYADGPEGGLYYNAWNGSSWAETQLDPSDGLYQHGLYNSLVLDADGHPHVGYFSRSDAYVAPDYPQGLRYAHLEGTGWVIEQVDAACSACGDGGVSLALDASGNPRIAYSDATSRAYPDHHDLKYAAWNGTGWDIQTVDAFGDVGYSPSLVLDGAGNAHIAYMGTGATGLMYAAWNPGAGAWDHQTVPASVPYLAQYAITSLALDQDGHPHIGYNATSDLRYVFWDGEAWQADPVARVGQLSSGGSMVLDGDGRAYFGVAISESPYNREFFVSEKELSGKVRATVALAGASHPKTAQFELCLAGGTIGATPVCKMAAGDGGRVEWMGLMAGSDCALTMTDATGWTEPAGQGVTVTSRNTTEVALAVIYDGSAAPDTFLTGRPMFDHNTTSDQAAFEFAADQTDCTYECSLDGGATWAACQTPYVMTDLAAGDHALQVRAKNIRGAVDASPVTFGWTVTPGAPWQIAFMPGTLGSASATHPGSVVIDAQGYPRVAYSADYGWRAYYNPWNGKTWGDYQTPPGADEVQLAIDAEGRTHMAYRETSEATSLGLRYAVWNGTAFDAETIENSGVAGLDLRLGADGEPRIAYFDGSLKYVTRDPADWRGKAWKIEALTSFEMHDGIISLALDADEHPHIAFQLDSAAVQYLEYGPGGWGPVETVYPAHSYQIQDWPAVSMIIGADGEPRVVFCDRMPDDGGGSELHYASRDAAGAWTSEVAYHLSDIADCGGPSLALDADGHPHISSYSWFRGPEYTQWTGTAWVTQAVDQFWGGNYEGQNTVMVLDAQGRPNIVYPDASAARMKFAVGEGEPRGAIQVTKEITGEGYPEDASFLVCVSGGGIGATPDCKTVTGNGGTATWANLRPGSDYVVAEQDAGADWTEPAAQTVSVASGQSTAVTISNSFADLTPPDTAITSGPAAASSTSTASFEFTSSETGSSFECSLDGAAFTACASPQPYTALADAGHNFRVRAKDAAGNTDATPASHDWTVDRPGQTIAFDAIADKTYGDAEFIVNPAASSGLAVGLSADGPCTAGSAGPSGWTVTITGAGSCTLTARQTGNENYEEATPVQRSFAVNRLSVGSIITADDKPYDGTAAAAISGCTLTGVLPADVSNVGCDARNAAFDSAAAGPGKTVTAAVALTGPAAANYELSAPAATTTAGIGKADAVIVVTPYNVAYDGYEHMATGTAYGVEGQPADLGSLLNLAATAHSDPGTYQDAWTFAGNDNYNQAGGTVEDSIAQITTVTIVLGNLNPTYDGSARHASATTDPAGVNVAITYEQGAAPVTDPINAGSYDVFATVNQAGYQGEATATLVIAPLTIDVTANAQGKVYGQPDPALTYTCQPAPAGSDTFSGEPARMAGENAGTYAIEQGTLALSDNYTLNFTAADLTIGQAPLTITAANETISEGDALPPFTVSYSGFAFGENESVLQGTLACSAGAAPAEAGSRTIHCSGLNSTNYAIQWGDGTLTINNVAPSNLVVAAPAAPTPMNTVVTVNATFEHPATGESHDLLWEWGDGTSSTASLGSGPHQAGASHTYTGAGVYVVTLTVSDAHGGSVTASTTQYVVVYDPTGSFVTGGGWIVSPAGAYQANPALTGPAYFGFVSKYEKGNTVPAGTTEFQFQLGDINFHSTAYEWLVIAGPKAQFKGSGTVNGGGNYGFLLTAWDGGAKNGGGMDKFRIKIWDKATGQVAYDNQMGAGDTADPTTGLAGGSIVIHAK